MRGDPDIATVAALIGDPARAAILAAVADGRALPAGELAASAGLSASGASAHLNKLMAGGLLALEREGRHRYYRLAGPQVAAALESLSLIATQPRNTVAHSPQAQALRYARSCYDHLAGELGVGMAVALETRGLIAAAGHGKRVNITRAGAEWFDAVFAIDVRDLKPGRHGLACRCLDWTERRHHLAGPLGTRLFQRCCDLGWLSRHRQSRAVELTRKGQHKLREHLGIDSII
ncbi:helix-turn-helix domain-containing protein [Bradyrhizobium sp.]|uniref:ArsR/SmtB family transcription factor n=1 Tax=Bradyrhizobium sp. TaxID=376 RepID=UPI00262587D0|nr:helix-turn-helix domain-containing protein [Bradyrhizobium sp.]